MTRRHLPAVAALSLLLAACSGHAPRPDRPTEPADGPPSRTVDPDSVPQPTPRAEPRSRYGNPESYQVFGRTYRVMDSADDFVETGVASWYGTKFQGRRTSSGEPYDMFRYTAAHKTLPLPTYAQVTNLENGRTVIVRINDRGPFKDDRIIDLSYIAAQKLGYADKGTARVEVRAVDPERETAGHKDNGASPSAEGSGSHPIFLQAGSFSRSENAERLRRRLSNAGLGPVAVQPVRVEGSTFFRVRIGPLAGSGRANDMMERIRELGLEPPRLIVD